MRRTASSKEANWIHRSSFGDRTTRLLLQTLASRLPVSRSYIPHLKTARRTARPITWPVCVLTRHLPHEQVCRRPQDRILESKG
ncbi:hypothetical protein WJX77_004112 [Trebouxia sp. C0004]